MDWIDHLLRALPTFDLAGWLAGGLMALGAGCLLTGAVGLVRFPDLFIRMHASSVGELDGALAVMLGVMIEHGWRMISLKIFVVMVLLVLTNLTSTYALAQLSLRMGIGPSLQASPSVAPLAPSDIP